MLELIDTGSGYYWYLDYRFDDDSGGQFAESYLYETDKEAIEALINNNITWQSKEN